MDGDEIIDYIKSLKRGFDKDLFQNKIDQLAYIADTDGGLQQYNDFHTLFKLWLNLSIPIKKWMSLGECLVPAGGVQERTIDYALRWLLHNCDICNQQGTFSRTAYLLDWLTAAMDSHAIDIEALDSGYEIFYTLLAYEVLTPHVLKLVYTLTKPSDVTRRRVLELQDYAKKREKKSQLRQIQVLLGLFKSYKPECVPEDVPAISVHTSFKKLKPTLFKRFERCMNQCATTNSEKYHLLWTNPINSLSGHNKKADPLVPNLEYVNVGSSQYSSNDAQKNYFDFADPSRLLKHTLHYRISRPAQLRALMCNQTGLTLLTLASHQDHASLSHQLHHLLKHCFLESSPYTREEKRDFLHRLAVLQRTLLQGIPVVTAFLARFLPLWDHDAFFGEILELVEWLHVETEEQLSQITEPLIRLCRCATSLQQCAVLAALTRLYHNLAFTSTRSRHHFLSSAPLTRSPDVLRYLNAAIMQLSHNMLQADPDDIRLVYSSVRASEELCRASLRYGTALSALPPPLPLALWLLTPCAPLIDRAANLLILYRKVFSSKSMNQLCNKELANEQRKTLKSYTVDIMNCLYYERALSERKDSLIFDKLRPQLVEKLTSFVPDADARFSLRNHLAFAPYTYISSDEISCEVTNKQCLEVLKAQGFGNLIQLLTKAVPELR